MTDLNAIYEEQMYDLAFQKMEKLTCAEIVEALSNSVEIDELEKDLTMAVRRCVPTLVVHSICYQYWRNIIAGKNPFSEWVETYKENQEADQEEQRRNTYEMNNGSD